MSSKYGHNSYSHIAGAATTQVKTGSGILRRVTVNLSGAGTINFHDSTTTTDPDIALVTITAAGTEPFTLEYGVPFTSGLRVVTTGTIDITVVYA